MPLGAPAAIAFRYQHLLHHRYLGETGFPDGRDTQAPTPKEIAFVGRSSVRKFLSFTFGRFFFKQRAANTPPRDFWLVANLAACVLTDVGIVAVAGPRPLVYLVLSSLIAFGPSRARRPPRRGAFDHPGRSAHELLLRLLNRVSFDVGYHVEHHDFPAVPWRRMRQLRAMAHEHYDGLAYVASWGNLMAMYFFDRRFGVGQYTGASADFLQERPVAPGPVSDRRAFARALVLGAR